MTKLRSSTSPGASGVTTTAVCSTRNSSTNLVGLAQTTRLNEPNGFASLAMMSSDYSPGLLDRNPTRSAGGLQRRAGGVRVGSQDRERRRRRMSLPNLSKPTLPFFCGNATRSLGNRFPTVQRRGRHWTWSQSGKSFWQTTSGVLSACKREEDYQISGVMMAGVRPCPHIATAVSMR